MAISVHCDGCGSDFEVTDEVAGTEQRCPSCAEELPPRNLPLAIVAACIAAVVGAVAWGVIAKATGYEVGYVAWGIGGLVGLAAVKVGGRGADLAVLCAGLSLVAILAGKAFAFSWAVSSDLDDAKSDFNQQAYAETQTDASDFAQLPADADDDALRQFMHDHDFSTAAVPGGISTEEIEFFRAGQIPYFREFEHEKPSFETWRDVQYASWRAGVEAEISLVEGVQQSLGMLDLLFAFLGVSTAYGLVMSATNRGATVPSVRT